MRSPLSRTRGGLRALFRRARVDRELDAELRDFLEMAVEERMRTGMSRVRPSPEAHFSGR